VCHDDENHSLRYVTGVIEQIFLERFGSVIAVDTNTEPSKKKLA
jgi:hypothetical protein